MKNILVVDDNGLNLRAAKDCLKNYYFVETISSGKKAIEYLNKNKCDLILLDLYMPEMDGQDVLKILKQDENTKNIPVIILTSDVTDKKQSECLDLGADDFISKPINPSIMLRRIARLIELNEYRKRVDKIIKFKTEQIQTMQRSLIISFAKIIESRDIETGDHINRTKAYVEMITTELMNQNQYTDIIDKNYINTIAWAAPLHDIGKIGIPDAILLKPGKLTCSEFDQMKAHTTIGGRMLDSTLEYFKDDEYLKVAKDMALYHHEKWTGTGYPFGLSEYQIPLSARIMAVADVFDACTSKRCYKDAMPVNKALNILIEGKENQFDPKVVEAFLECIRNGRLDDVIKKIENRKN